MSNLRLVLLAVGLVLTYKGITKKLEEMQIAAVKRGVTEEFLYVLDTMGVKFPEVALSQMIHETNGFKSKICRENHNVFGMKESSRHFDIGSKNGHANYDHMPHEGRCNIKCYMASIRDYRAWQRQMLPLSDIKTSEEYIWYLQHLPCGSSYAEDKCYPERLNFYINLLK